MPRLHLRVLLVFLILSLDSLRLFTENSTSGCYIVVLIKNQFLFYSFFRTDFYKLNVDKPLEVLCLKFNYAACNTDLLLLLLLLWVIVESLIFMGYGCTRVVRLSLNSYM